MGTLLAATSLARPSHATSGGELVWTYSSGSENWIGRTVALGNQGGNVFAEFEGYNGSARLFSSQDVNPPTPLWQNNVAYMSYSSRVDAADSANVDVALRFDQASSTAPRVPVVSRYASNSSTPAWSYSFPFSVINTASGISVSRDGQTIAAWVFDYGTMKTTVAVFGSASGTPRSYTQLYTAGLPLSADLSADGSALLVVSQMKTMVLQLATATTSYDVYNTQTMNRSHAISGDGSIFAQSVGQKQVLLYRRQGTTYQPWFTHVIDSEAVCSNLAISDDSSTLVCGFNSSTSSLQVRTQVIDLRSPQHAVVLDDTVTGGGSAMNVITDLDVCADGHAAAVGLSGDLQGLAPEVLAYARDPQTNAWSRVFSYDLPGSVNDIDISADGKRVAVASKSVHMSVPGSGGRIDLFKLGPTTTNPPTADIAVFGEAHLGSTLTFRQYLTPGKSATLLRAPALAPAPQTLAGIGVLYLDRPKTKAAATGTANASGVFETTLLVPMDASLVGRTFYFQGFSTTPDALSHDWVSVTVVP